MTPIDKLIRLHRVRQAMPHIPLGARLLDVGCHDGYFINKVAKKCSLCVGIDTQNIFSPNQDNTRFIKGRFPDELPRDERFDCISMLAVAEHLPEDVYEKLPMICRDILAVGGRLVITQPSILVDKILILLNSLHLIAEDVHIEDHKGLDPKQLIETFAKRKEFSLVLHRKFQLGLNNLIVFEKVRA